MPNVAVHAVCLILRRNGDAVLLRIGDLCRARVKIPFTPRCDDLEIGRKRLDRQLKTHLIVPFSCCTMSNGIRPLALRDVNERLGNHRAGKRSAEQIFALVYRTCLQCRPDILLKELLREIDDEHLRCTRGECFVVNNTQFIALSNIGTGSDNLTAIVVLFQPRNDHRRIQSAGIGKNDFFDLFSHNKTTP